MDADAIMDVGYMNACGLEALACLVSTLLPLRRGESTYEEPAAGSHRTIQERLLTAMLLAVFLSTLALLYVFPVAD